MKKYLLTGLLAVALTAGFLASCSDDDEDGKPSISLSKTEATAAPEEDVAVTVTTKTPAGFKSLVVTKLWDGVAVAGSEETFTEELDEDYVYTVIDADADHVLSIQFTVTDKNNKTSSKDLVITIDLTARQLLLKYNWRVSEEIRKKTNEDELQDVYNDDVYRFNADGTYNKSIGAKKDDFGDIVFNYCYYSFNDNTMKLLMSRSGYGDPVDTLIVTVIDETKFYANINNIGLEIFDPTYDHVEAYEKRFVAVAKTSNFDPYLPGNTDDATGPAGADACTPMDFEND